MNPSTMVSGNNPAKSAKRLNRGRWAANAISYRFEREDCE
jgi:hypothetical protein